MINDFTLLESIDPDDPHDLPPLNVRKMGRRGPYFGRQPVKPNKRKPFNTFLHYSSGNTKDHTVFGVPSKGPYGHGHLDYTYSNRLFMEEWGEGLEAALEQGIPRHCARYFEIGLEHVFGKDIDLQHVILGVNKSNGYSYLVFGYTSTERNTDEGTTSQG